MVALYYAAMHAGVLLWLAHWSSCIVLEMVKSDNLRTELEYLRNTGLQSKLFVIRYTQPTGIWQKLRFGRACVNREVFSRDLAKLGYDLPKNEPGLGSVITFDERRQGIVLTTGAREPVEYVEPIKAWLSSHEKIGRCIPASCIACGREFHVFPADVPEVRERWCRACAADLNWFERLLVKSEAAPLLVLVLLELLILGACLPKEGWLHDYVPWISGPAVLIQIWVWVQVGESNLCRIGRRIISKYLTLAAAGDVIATFIEIPPNKNLDHTFRSQ